MGKKKTTSLKEEINKEEITNIENETTSAPEEATVFVPFVKSFTSDNLGVTKAAVKPLSIGVPSSIVQNVINVNRTQADPRLKALINELESQFKERLEKLGLGNSIDDSHASVEEKMSWYSKRDEFIGRELFRKYGWEDFITFAEGIAVSDYWNGKIEYMRPCNAYNGSCRFDCPFLEDGQVCPQKN